jgi:hypothetical protein
VGARWSGFSPFLALPRNLTGFVISTRESLILRKNRAGRGGVSSSNHQMAENPITHHKEICLQRTKKSKQFANQNKEIR